MLHEWRERWVASRAAAAAAAAVPRPEPTASPEPAPAPPERRRLRFERSGDGLVSAPAGGSSNPPQPSPVQATPAATAQATEPASTTADIEDALITSVNSINAELTKWVLEPGTFRPLARLSRNSAHAIVTDHLGTPIRMYDRLGRELGSLEFTVYGMKWGAGFRGWTGCPFRYPG